MCQVSFTQNIQRHVACPPQRVNAATVAEALDAIFRDNPEARSYVLDDRGAVRQHMVIFVDGEAIRDRTGLSDPVTEESKVYIMQALSGG